MAGKTPHPAVVHRRQ